jgi:hypothetical protein
MLADDALLATWMARMLQLDCDGSLVARTPFGSNANPMAYASVAADERERREPR